MQPSITSSSNAPGNPPGIQPSQSETDNTLQPPTPADVEIQGAGYHVRHGSGASGQSPARLVPGGARTRRAATAGGEDGTSATGGRKRLAASALSPDPKVLPESDTAKLQELLVGNVTAEIVKGLPNVKDATELAGIVRQQTETLRQHEEAIRLLRGTALEQDSRLKAALAKLNLTIAATDKLDDAMEMVDQLKKTDASS